MKRVRTKRNSIKNGILKAVIALGIAFSPTPAFASQQDDPAPNHQQTERLYEPRDSFLRNNADGSIVCFEEQNILIASIQKLIGENPDALKDSNHTLYLKSTLVDGKKVSNEATLDEIYARPDWMDLVYGQYTSSLDLLDPGDESEFYIAYAGATQQNKVGSASDSVFAELSNEGVVLTGAFFDKETSIAYVPKGWYKEANVDIPFACQLQLLIPSSLEESKKCTTDVIISCSDWRITTTAQSTITNCAFDVTTSVFVCSPEQAGYVSLDKFHVRLNGSRDELVLKDNENAFWDSSKGTLELLVSPQTLLSVDIAIDAPNVLELLAQPALAIESSSLAYVPNVVFDSLNLPTLYAGRSLDFYTWVNYWWPNPAPYDNAWQACIATGSYCYSWINDPDSLYEYLAWADGANWNGVSTGNVSNFFVTPNGTQASRNYFNYAFELGNWQIEDQNFHSSSWPITQPDAYGSDWATFGLQCSHIKNPVGGKVPPEGQVLMRMRILEVNTNNTRPYIVLGFVGPSIANQPGVGVYKFEIQVDGDIALKVSSDNASLSSNNSTYHLNKLLFDVYSDNACTQYVESISLDGLGNGKSNRLKKGTYYVKQNQASAEGSGFAVDNSVYTVEVTPGTSTPLLIACSPQSYEANMLIKITDAITANSTPQGDGMLSGAIFEISHYGEIAASATPKLRRASYAKNNKATASMPQSNALRSWQFKTNDDGEVIFDENHKVQGDDFYTTTQGALCIPLGTIVISEIQPSLGYRATKTPEVIPLSSSGTEKSITFTKSLLLDKEIVCGDVGIEKRDAESMLFSALGSASLDDTAFEVRNESTNSVCVNGVMYQPGERIQTITSKDGLACTNNNALPFGTYSVTEIAAGKGYETSDTRSRTISVRTDGVVIAATQHDAAANQVKRGDIDFVKILASNQSRLAKVPFKLTSETTGEEHVVVTDDNGVVHTSAQWNPHSQNTNGNDFALHTPENQLLNADLFDLAAGVWFGKTQDGELTRPNDMLGALPYDTYTLTELPASSNIGLEMVNIEGIKVTAHGMSVALGTIENRLIPPPAITTYASNALDGAKTIFPNASSSIIDKVEYCNLVPGRTYTLQGSLHNGATGEALADDTGNTITASLRFQPTTSQGECEIVFNLNTSSLAGMRIVCFETVIDTDLGVAVAEHTELQDYAQSIDVAEARINTYATNMSTGTKEALPETSFVIEDAVSYHGLEPGVEYKLVGSLMRKNRNARGLFAEPVLDEQQQPLTCTVDFVPESTTGNTKVRFAVDAQSAENNAEFVVYETLFLNDEPIVVHENPANDAQSIQVRNPKIGSSTTINDINTPLGGIKRGPSFIRSLPKTGDSLAILPYFIALLLLLTCLGVLAQKLGLLKNPSFSSKVLVKQKRRK